MSKTKILVVEDEAITAEVIADQLEALGYAVTGTASSAGQAIASIAQTPPDLVLMDINLGRGEIDGITIAARIREQFKIPVVYLTAYSDDATLERAKVTEPFGYILKPFNERDLRVAIETALYKHQMERQLIKHKELLENILHSTADAVLATNETGEIIYLNPAAEALTGWPLGEASGQGITEVIKFVDETTGQPTENPVMRVLQEGRVMYLDDNMALVAKDGTQIPVADSASPMFQETKTVTGVVLVLWDLRERRQVELLAKEAVASQKAVAETQQLLAAERELNELKSRLIATISHEYRTPLAIIKSSADILQRYSDRFSQQKKDSHLNRIKSSVDRMTQLLNDVLTFTKAEAGALPCHPQPLDVVKFCRELIEDQKIIAEENYTLNFTYLNSPENRSEGATSTATSHSPLSTPLITNLDEQLLRQILTNLLTNAIKYSPYGGTISLLVFCENNQIVFQVQDRGMGIPKADQQRLFTPFFRASNTGITPGTGMGLSIAKKSVELHGGRITFTSEVGVGTTFTVKLPFVN